MADKHIKALEKVLAQETKIDQQQIARAEKELHKVEKLHKASLKEVAKAEKTLEKATKSRMKAEKGVLKAQKVHGKAAEGVDKAERLVEEMNKRENIEAQDLQQRHSHVSESFGEFHAHEHSRIQQRSEVLGAGGVEGEV